MTHIFNERVQIDHIDEDEIPINVSLPITAEIDEKSLLQEILIELKKINVHLSTVTNDIVTEEDL
jgi:hypothetical protein